MPRPGPRPQNCRLDIQPANLAVWSRRALSLGLLDRNRAYWRELFQRGRSANRAPRRRPARPRRHPRIDRRARPVPYPARPARARSRPRDDLVRGAAREPGDAARRAHRRAGRRHRCALVGARGDGGAAADWPLPQRRPRALPRRRWGICETLGQRARALMGALAHGAVPFERIVADVNAPAAARGGIRSSTWCSIICRRARRRSSAGRASRRSTLRRSSPVPSIDVAGDRAAQWALPPTGVSPGAFFRGASWGWLERYLGILELGALRRARLRRSSRRGRCRPTGRGSRRPCTPGCGRDRPR